MKCSEYTNSACVDGSCPVALSHELPDYSLPADFHCRECFYNDGSCKDCIFDYSEICPLTYIK